MTEQEKMAKEDKKDSANISVGLSSQLIAASLTFIAILGGLITFVLDKKNPTLTFYILYAISFISFITSIYLGGRGIQFVKKAGENGDWKTKEEGKTNWFSYQSLLILIGIVAVGFMPFIGTEKSTEDPKMNELRHLVKKSIEYDSLTNLKLDSLIRTIEEKRTTDIERKIKYLEEEIIKLKRKKQ